MSSLFKRLFRYPIKKFCYIGFGSGTMAYYFYERHQYDKELYGRMVYLLENNVKLSGVYLQQRQAFGFIGHLQWLIPYHQSLKIIIPNSESGETKVRHIGLGSVGGLTSEFVQHDATAYAYFNSCESSLPIECCVEYYRKTGHFPENVDPEELNKLTMTTRENNNLANPVYNTTFGSIIVGIDGKKTVSTCKTAILWALQQEEKKRFV